MSRSSPIPTPDALNTLPLQASGLPPRILAALRGGGLKVLRGLCGPLPHNSRLDADDQALLERVAECTRWLAGGNLPSFNLPGWMGTFLTPRLREVIQLHFALDNPSPLLSAHEMRLRETGARLGVTRERTRQLLELATGMLRQPLPLAAAEPLFRAATESLENNGGVLMPEDLAPLSLPVWGGHSPVGTFLLLIKLDPERLTLYRGFFSLCPPRQLEQMEHALRDELSAVAGLQPIAELAHRLPSKIHLNRRISATALLQTMARHLPDLLATRDGRCGLAARDGGDLLCEVLADLGEAPLRQITDAFNERLLPECRRGSGYVRDALGRHPLIHKVSPGRYDLPGGLQADLPM